MAQTKRPDARHIPYMVSIKMFKIYPLCAPIFKNLHYGLWGLQSGNSVPVKENCALIAPTPIFGVEQSNVVI